MKDKEKVLPMGLEPVFLLQRIESINYSESNLHLPIYRKTG